MLIQHCVYAPSFVLSYADLPLGHNLNVCATTVGKMDVGGCKLTFWDLGGQVRSRYKQSRVLLDISCASRSAIRAVKRLAYVPANFSFALQRSPTGVTELASRHTWLNDVYRREQESAEAGNANYQLLLIRSRNTPPRRHSAPLFLNLPPLLLYILYATFGSHRYE